MTQNLSMCTEMTEYEIYIADQLDFWLGIVLLGIICGIGIAMNCLAIFILVTRKELKNIFNFLLIQLLLFDTVLLILTVLRIILNMFGSYNRLPYAHYLAFVGLAISMTGSIYMTIVIALERYVCTNYPVAHQRYWVGSNSYLIYYLKFVLPVTVFVVCFNIPQFFEMEIVWDDDTDFSFLKATDLRVHPHYVTYYVNYGRLFITGIIPLLCLLYCNTMIFKRIKEVTRYSGQPRQQMEHKLAKVLIVIVLVFIICHIPRLGLNFHEAMAGDNICLSVWILVSLSINKLFLTINSSVNVFIYCCLDRKFRAIIFCQTNNSRNREHNYEEPTIGTQMLEINSHVEIGWLTIIRSSGQQNAVKILIEMISILNYCWVVFVIFTWRPCYTFIWSC